MNTVAKALYLIVGVVNLLPVSGVLSVPRLQALYGVSFTDPNVIILMRHRAVLFAIIGALLAAAAFVPRLRPVAVGAGLVSMLSFVLLAYSVGDFNAELQRVVVVDIVASILLALAAVITFQHSRHGLPDHAKRHA